MSNVIVIYQNIPETTDVYILKGVSDKDLVVLKDCANRYINTESENKSCGKLNYWLSKKENFCEEWGNEVDLPEEECGKFADAKIEAISAIETKDIDFVVITGFFI